MDYTEYTGSQAEVSEYYVTVSDGVVLKIIDFVPLQKEQSGPVIVFIAGWLSLISGWKEFLRVITPISRIIYVETREKSSSIIRSLKKVSFTMERMKDDIGDVIDSIIPRNMDFVLAGSSLGSSSIMQYCISERRSPLCTALVGPNAEFRHPAFVPYLIRVLHPSIYSAVKPVIKWYLRRFRVNSEAEKEQIEKYEMTLDYADPYKLKKNALAILKWSLDRNAVIDVPSLILGATTDSLHSTDHLKEIMSHFKNGEYIELASNRETHSAKAAHVMMEYISRQNK